MAQCPTCLAKVADHPAKDERPRIVKTYKTDPLYSNPKGQAKAAKMRQKNQKKGL